jgi:hypothetical protein
MIKLKDLLESVHKDVVSIFESPMRLNNPWDAEQLNSLGKNNSFTIGIKEKATLIGNFDNYELYKYNSGNYIINVLVLKNLTIAFVQYKIKNNIVEIERVWQDATYTGLVRKFIFEYLLKMFDGILSSDSHTELGQKYWDKLLKQALNKGFKIFVVNKDEKIQLDNNFDINNYYSNSIKSMDYKFLIEK